MTGYWSVEPIFDSYLAITIAMLVLLALLALGPRFGRLTRRRRLTLLTLRTILVLFLLLAMLQPSYVYTDSQPQTAAVLLLFDESQSMEQPGTSGERTRWEDQVKLLNTIEPILAGFDENLKVKVLSLIHI